MRLATITLSLVAAAVAAAMPANNGIAESADYPGCVVSFAGVASGIGILAHGVNSGSRRQRYRLPGYLHR